MLSIAIGLAPPRRLHLQLRRRRPGWDDLTLAGVVPHHQRHGTVPG